MGRRLLICGAGALTLPVTLPELSCSIGFERSLSIARWAGKAWIVADGCRSCSTVPALRDG